MLATLRLAASLFWRDLKSGQWFILFTALFLSVTAITSLDFYTNRVRTGIAQQASHLLGGDIAIVSNQPIPNTWEHEANSLGIRYAQVWTYPSVAKSKQQFQLVTVQAVSDNYPIINTENESPKSGSVWVEPRLLSLLSLKMDDSIQIGDANFTITRQLSTDKDMINTGLLIAPRLVMLLKDVPATKTIIAGSRVEYRLLLAGPKAQLTSFKRWITPQLKNGQRIITIQDQQSSIQRIINEIESYLQFVMLICLAMTSVAIAIGVNYYLREHHAAIAMFRCLGMQRQQLIVLLTAQLGFVAFLSGLAGTGTGYLIQSYVSPLFSHLLPISVSFAGWSPIAKGFITSLFLLFAFSYPLINDLPKTPPLYLWRGQTNSSAITAPYYLLSFILIMTVLLYWIIDIHLLTLFYIDVILFSVALLYLLNTLYSRITKHLVKYTTGGIKRGLSSLIQHPESVNLQFSGMTLILTCIFLLTQMQDSLILNWKQYLPANSPNYFIFNIAPSDRDSLNEYFKTNHIASSSIYPMIRGRISKLNDKPILTAIPLSARQHNALHRELNLSWMDTYPSDNKIIKGTAWTKTDNGKAYASVESSLATSLQLKLGDTLTFNVGDQTINAKIVNIRTVDWTSFHPNFYIIFPPGFVNQFPATYITSFYLPTKNDAFLNGLTQQYPNLTLIDISNIFKQIQSIIMIAGQAVRYLLLFAGGGGLLIIIASLQSSMLERKQTWQLLRILGASRRYIVISIISEFTYLFFTIFISAAILADFLFYFIAKNVFH